MQRRASAALATAVVGICGFLWQAAPASQESGWQVTDVDVGPALEVDIAVDANGNAVAVWVKQQSVVGATFSIADGTWSPPVTLSNTGDFGSQSQVEVDPAGDAIAVWRGVRSSDAASHIGVSKYSAASRAWSQVATIPAQGYQPQAVIDLQGNATVAWAEWLRDDPPDPDDWYQYPTPVYEIRSVRYDARTTTLSPPLTLSGEGAWAPQIGIDAAGNATVVWAGDRIESVRWSSATHSWSGVTRLGQSFLGIVPQIVVDSRGDVIAVWSDSGIRGAMFSASSGTWSPATVVAPFGLAPSVGVDSAGNVTVVWAEVFRGEGVVTRLRSKSFLRSTTSWTDVTEIASIGLVSGFAPVTVDPNGVATVAWRAGIPNQSDSLSVARRPLGGEWSTVTAFVDTFGSFRIVTDAVGNLLLMFTKRTPFTFQAARWTAPSGSPSMTQVTSSSGALSIEFIPPRVLHPAYAVLNYEYSLDDGATWITRTPASTVSPIVLDGLTDGIEYPVRLRGVNTLGPGMPSESLILTPGLAAPANLTVANVAGNTVTLSWSPPPGSVLPTGYLVEGGTAPNTAIARLPSPGPSTIFTAAAPTGIFYVRVRATRGRSESQPSNETVINRGVAGPPSAPINLLALADGDFLALAWQNTFAGGAPSNIVLDVSGDRSETIPLPVSERFAFPGVPAGTYTFALRAVNGFGVSTPSNSVTLTFPGTCSPPGTPGSLALSKQSNTISAFWSLPATGAAPTGYVLNVMGTINDSFSLTERTVSGAVPPGTYTISVAAANACGSSAPTPAKSITIP